MAHIPVLLKEVVEVLNPQPGEFFIDGTIGSAGHAIEILKEILPKGRLLGIDWDKNNLRIAEERIKKAFAKDAKNLFGKGSRITLVYGNYADLPEILKSFRDKKFKSLKANGLLLDLGFSSEQLESADRRTGRGFSFLKNEPLDMRYNIPNVSQMKSNQSQVTAAEVVNSFGEKELADIFWKYSGERFSRKIARQIKEDRKKKKILTTFDLVETVKKAVPKNYERGRIHPATRIFQALRIYVNDELGNLERLLKNMDKIIENKGRIAVISFHSLEDRLVKNYFRQMNAERKAEILTKKPIIPTRREIAENSRARSAKLRAIVLK